jgi:hypothetical protein
MVCTLSKLEKRDGNEYFQICSYTCDEVRNLKDKWLEDFRKRNRSDEVIRDEMYEQFKQKIEDFLSECDCIKE